MANSVVQDLSPPNAWSLPESQRLKTPKTVHKVSLVTPRMDVDVTGLSLRNLRTHLIDHPRDEGLKQREQLWNFQQRYRGAALKQKTVSMSRSASATDSNDKIEADRKLLKTVKSDPAISLHARFRRRYFNKLSMSPVRRKESASDINKWKGGNESNDKDKANSGIQRLYSSGLVVRNSLYNQIRGTEMDEKRVDSTDNPSLVEAMEKFGSLDKLPDIPYSQPTLTSRFMRTLNTYGRRYGDPNGKLLQLRRSLTNLSDVSTLSSSERRLLIYSRREYSVHMDCIDSGNDDDDDDDDDGDNDDDDDEDSDDECNIDDDALRSQRLGQREESSLSIRKNVTHINSEDDLELIDSQQAENSFQKDVNKRDTEFTLSYVPSAINNHHSSGLRDGADQGSAFQVSPVVLERKTDSGKMRENETAKLKNSVSKSNKKDKIDDKVERASSTDSLDMPKERFGHTTHSIDRKLAIRKPWEWRPSPFRWTDKSVKESDKPYIEKILNRGEIIDEYNYDAFARTKPLKLSSYPDPPYKDRNGVLR